MDEEFIKTMLKLHTFSALDTFGSDAIVVLNEGETGEYKNNPTIKKFEGIGYRLCDANMFGKGLERYETLTFCKRKDKENQAEAASESGRTTPRMEIRNVTKEDLPKIAALLNDETLATRSDICFEHSKLMFNEDGVIDAFIVLRQYSLNEFFGGDIPLRKLDKNDKGYKEGDECDFQKMLNEYFSDNSQFELLYAFGGKFNLHNLYRNIWLEENVGLVWSTIQNKYLTKELKKYHFAKYNDDFFYDMERID